MLFYGTTVLSSRLWVRITIFLLLASEVTARADLVKFFTGKDGFRRYDPDSDNGHGCKRHANALSQSYEEAAKLIDAAVDAIASVKTQPRPNLMKASARWDWTRKAQSMKSFFGISIDKNGGPIKDHAGAFAFVENIFRLMQNGMNNDIALSSQGLKYYPGLYCGDSSWKYLDKTDQIPDLPYTQRVQDLSPLGGSPYFPKGAWYYERGLYAFTDQDKDKSKPSICVNKRLAVTCMNRIGNSFITWCENGFQHLKTVTDTTYELVPAALDDPKRQSMAYTWVHELAHLYGSGDIPDMPAIDHKGNSVPDTLSYGMGAILNLAEFAPDKASKNADSYGWFAVAMYLNKRNWSTGDGYWYPL